MSDVVEKVAHAWASMDGKPYGEGYVEDAAFLLRRSGVGRRIEELEEMLTSATMDGYDMAKNEYRSHIEELEAENKKLHKALEIYERERTRFKHAKPEMTGEFFIAGCHGSKDNNLMPQFIEVCPAYGAGWVMIYENTGRTISYEGS